MPLKFTKLHGLGNDYVFISLFDQEVTAPETLARAISDRHRGVGSDGLILISPPEAEGAHVRMIMYNADGSRAQMCGNGVRCAAKLAYERGLARANPLCVQTDTGVLPLELTLDEFDRVTQVRADMGVPALKPEAMPVDLPGERIVGHALSMEGATLSMTCVSMGNPHAVFFEPDLKRVPLKVWGPQIEHHPLFPERTNVHFAQVVRPDFIGMVTWERGAGITQACGTGAAAVCVAAVLNELSERQVTVRLPGGQLRVEWDVRSRHVYLTGPAEEVFTGIWPG